jgi:hypothetical protein
MSARQRVLRRHSVANRFVPLVFARVPLFGPKAGCLPGRDPCWATLAANPPDHTLTIASNCERDGQKNRDANTLFWLGLTIFRMNTCAKRVGGWGYRFSTLTLTPRGGMQGLGERVGMQLHAPPRLRYSAAQGSGENF